MSSPTLNWKIRYERGWKIFSRSAIQQNPYSKCSGSMPQEFRQKNGPVLELTYNIKETFFSHFSAWLYLIRPIKKPYRPFGNKMKTNNHCTFKLIKIRINQQTIINAHPKNRLYQESHNRGVVRKQSNETVPFAFKSLGWIQPALFDFN